jgi:thiosulfate reductase cytochrome b subunit
VESDGVRRLTPVNLVSRYRWISASTREAVPATQIAAAYLEQGRYAPAVLEAFDRNHDGLLDESELRLDAPAKTALVTARLAALGIIAPTIEGTLETHPLAHGVAPRSHALRDCDGCHAAGSRLSAAFPIVPFLPGGVAPLPPDSGGPLLAGKIIGTPGGGLTFLRETAPAAGSMYVLGATRHAWSNRLGFLIFLAVALGVTGHGSVRYLMTKRAGHAPHAAPGATEKVRVFGRYERLWHWTMAGSGLVLIVTGLGIHNAGSGWMGPLPKVVLVHNVAAVVLTVNAFLSLFYHLATVAIRSFIPEPVGFMKRVLEHVSYQSRGIFVGAPHPPQAATEKLNPLQQITYLALLNVLFPVQIVSGTLIWVIGRWPTFATALGGLSIVAPVHNFGAWLFLSFFVLHAYLVTTGRTVGDHLQSMVTGYRTVESEEQTP